MSDKDKIFIVMPVFNEGPVVSTVISDIKKTGYKNIIAVDDGSIDNTNEELKKNEIILLTHNINRGKGAAVKTGMEAAKMLGAELVVTMDGDGQHAISDIEKLTSPIKKGYDAVLGSRIINPKGMPFYKIVYNYAGNIFTWMFYGLFVTDSQSGFRAYSKKAIELMDTKTDRYEYDSEVIREIRRHNLKFIEVPITVKYTEYSMGKQNKQGFKNGVKTLLKMIISSK